MLIFLLTSRLLSSLSRSSPYFIPFSPLLSSLLLPPFLSQFWPPSYHPSIPILRILFYPLYLHFVYFIYRFPHLHSVPLQLYGYNLKQNPLFCPLTTITRIIYLSRLYVYFCPVFLSYVWQPPHKTACPFVQCPSVLLIACISVCFLYTYMYASQTICQYFILSSYACLFVQLISMFISYLSP
jgi:hypothetical protein